MGSRSSDDPVIQQLQLLLAGYGYTCYSSTSHVRNDDMQVRERASYFLAHAADLLTQLRGAYHRQFVPPLTLEHPDPPQEPLARIREIEELQQELGRVEAHIRGMSVLSQDKAWWRSRQKQGLLGQLLRFDLEMVRRSEQLYQYTSSLTPESWRYQGSALLRQMIQQVVQVAQERERFLLLPV